MENVVNGASEAFWRGKRVLLTGHTGFKGGWLALWLHKLGAKVAGVALPPAADQPNLFEKARISSVMDSHFCDIRDADALAALVRQSRPEIVLHLAAQPLVRLSYRQPLQTFDTNVMGTANLLDALRGLPDVRVALSITTDKVYRNEEWPYPYRESDALGGHDPYSASKAAAELVAACYRDAFLGQQGVALATARAGNVIGGGDWSEDRLLPDAVRAWQCQRTLDIRSPDAVRPWQHVLEPLAGYLRLAQALWDRPELAGPYNFGPPSQDTATVREVVELARAAYGAGEVVYGQSAKGPHEAGLLALDTSRARSVLGVRARWSLAQGVAETMRWYRAVQDGGDARALCEAQIAAFGPA
ncbi:CDP-glucose 4,6-dehydratase [Achromobacter marplatensis]|uniref:CDP-glucose 4,6-dehydratase n=1 Tax=Achromobacter marplatensis TaxID=470868 RepID=A0AA42WD49_9BURK|nr:CDP-glucose 4,6-dehydratase [Achromobacter marplatensis]MDH2053189.1 CDP-glucose 4,6-dehydratase [Achromobacter marplatensis]